MASAPSPCSLATNSCPSLSRRPDTTMRAPSCAKIVAAARPIPVNAPVIKTTGELIAHLLLVQIALLDCGAKRPEAYFVKLRAMLYRHGSGNGIAAPSLFCLGRGCGESYVGRRAKPAHFTTLVKP